MKKLSLHLALLIVISGIFFFLHLGSIALMEPDEGRNAEVAREILATGDWLTPHLNFVRYLDKPILFFWADAVSLKVFGVNEFAARFPSALAALIGVIAVYFLGRRMFGERAGLFSGLILATSPLYTGLGRIVIFDMMLTAFITLTMLFWYLGFTEEEKRKKRLFFLLSWAAMAFAVLTKGPIGAVFPLGIIGLFLLMTRDIKRIREMELLWGPLLFLAIAGPWYLLVSIRNPEYPYYFFISEHLLRYATTKFHRVKPFWYYFPIVIGGLLPWVFFLPSAIRRFLQNGRECDRGEKAALLLLGIWALLIFLFFNFSKAKMPMYILPMFPAAALLIGKFWDDYVSDRAGRTGILLPLLLLMTCMLAISGTLTFSDVAIRLMQNRISDFNLAGVAPILRRAGMIALIAFSTSLGMILYLREHKTLQLTAVMLVTVFLLAAGLWSFEVNGHRRSSKIFSERIRQGRQPGEPVLMYECFLSSFLFYQGEQVPVVSGFKGLIGSNFIVDYDLNHLGPNGSSIMGRDEFRTILADRRKTVYLLSKTTEEQRMIEEVGAFGKPERLIEQGKTALWVRRGSP